MIAMVSVAEPLVVWGTFCELVGSAAGALVGIQFVVMALIASTGRRMRADVSDAFSTPIVVHFCSALAVVAVVGAPWPSLGGAAWTLGGIGLAGLAYKAVVLRRMCRQTSYKLLRYDWGCYVVTPTAAYTLLTVAAACLPARPVGSLFAVAAATLVLLMAGIHNAWDTVMYILTGPIAAAADGAKQDARP